MNVLLTMLSEKLLPVVESIKHKGIDKSEFLYIINNGKSVEVSIHNDNIWVEYWDDCFDEDAEPKKENMFEVIDSAERSILNWLGT